jgi:thioredoxin 1
MKEITSASALLVEMTNTKSSLVVLDFFAPWCGPCKTLGPVLEKMQSKYPSVVFLKINADTETELTTRYSISALPTVLIFKKTGGKWSVVATIRGCNPSAVEKAIQENSS